MYNKTTQFNYFIRFLYKHKQENEDFLEGYPYYEGKVDSKKAKITVCPVFREVTQLPILYKIFENHGIIILEDKFEESGAHGYEQFHSLIVDYTHFRPENMVDNMLEDIICKQLD